MELSDLKIGMVIKYKEGSPVPADILYTGRDMVMARYREDGEFIITKKNVSEYERVLEKESFEKRKTKQLVSQLEKLYKHVVKGYENYDDVPSVAIFSKMMIQEYVNEGLFNESLSQPEKAEGEE